MLDVSPTAAESPPTIGMDTLSAAIGSARQALASEQRPDGHFAFELEADATIPADYILLRQYLGEPDDPEIERKIGVYLRRIQGAHGGWPLYHDGAFDVSATVKAYFALKTIGDDPAAPPRASTASRARRMCSASIASPIIFSAK